MMLRLFVMMAAYTLPSAAIMFAVAFALTRGLTNCRPRLGAVAAAFMITWLLSALSAPMLGVDWEARSLPLSVLHYGVQFILAAAFLWALAWAFPHASR